MARLRQKAAKLLIFKLINILERQRWRHGEIKRAPLRLDKVNSFSGSDHPPRWLELKGASKLVFFYIPSSRKALENEIKRSVYC